MTADTCVSAKSTVWTTGSDTGYYAETKGADTKEGVVRFLAKYSFDDSDNITTDKIKSYGIWFMKASDDSDFDNGTKLSESTGITANPGIFADITGITEDVTCYAKAYIVLNDGGDSADEYVWSDLITQKADFTKWLGAKTSSGGIDQGVGEDC